MKQAVSLLHYNILVFGGDVLDSCMSSCQTMEFVSVRTATNDYFHMINDNYKIMIHMINLSVVFEINHLLEK